MGTTVSPTRSVPASGASCPMIILNSVLLPAPLGPTMPASMQQHTLDASRSSAYDLHYITLRHSIAHKHMACGLASR